MKYQDFTNKWNTKYVDYDGNYGAQCVDLMRQYCKDVLGVDGYKAIPSRGNAKDIFKNFVNNQYFTKVLNTPTGLPTKGDIIFWTTYPFIYGIAGHVAIYDSGDLKSIVSFDQNYPTNSSCHFQKHSYKACLGWLTPKK